MNRAPLSQTAEDYLKEIYKLQVEQGKATTSALAERVGVSAPSATAMLKKLAAPGRKPGATGGIGAGSRRSHGGRAGDGQPRPRHRQGAASLSLQPLAHSRSRREARRDGALRRPGDGPLRGKRARHRPRARGADRGQVAGSRPALSSRRHAPRSLGGGRDVARRRGGFLSREPT